MKAEVRRFFREEDAIEEGREFMEVHCDGSCTIKEMLFELMSLDDEYVEDNYDGDLCECWWGELDEDVVTINGKEIQDLIDEDFDFDMTIEEVLEMVSE